MARFSSSYEKRDPADRLVDLVIALEALFGDSGDSSNLRYKLAMRGASWLHATECKRVALHSAPSRSSMMTGAVSFAEIYPGTSQVNGCKSSNVSSDQVCVSSWFGRCSMGSHPAAEI